MELRRAESRGRTAERMACRSGAVSLPPGPGGASVSPYHTLLLWLRRLWGRAELVTHRLPLILKWILIRFNLRHIHLKRRFLLEDYQNLAESYVCSRLSTSARRDEYLYLEYVKSVVTMSRIFIFGMYTP